MKAIKFLLTLVSLVMFFFTCTENDNLEPGPIPADSVDYALTIDVEGTDIALSPYFNFNYTDSGSFLVTVYENRDTVEVSSIINGQGKVESLTSIPPCTGSPSNQGDLLNIQSVRGYVIRTAGGPEVLLEIHSMFIFFPYVYECGTGTS